jgi:hypothetical protein
MGKLCANCESHEKSTYPTGVIDGQHMLGCIVIFQFLAKPCLLEVKVIGLAEFQKGTGQEISDILWWEI